jgi:hypothetical protein
MYIHVLVTQFSLHSAAVSGGQWGDWPSLVTWVRGLLKGEVEVEVSSNGESHSAENGASRLWESFAAGMLQAMPDHLKGEQLQSCTLLQRRCYCSSSSTVVSTLWPVDDGVLTLVKQHYIALRCSLKDSHTCSVLYAAL